MVKIEVVGLVVLENNNFTFYILYLLFDMIKLRSLAEALLEYNSIVESPMKLKQVMFKQFQKLQKSNFINK